ADLVRRQVAVIVTGGGATTAPAAQGGAATIPLVFNTRTDPPKLGVVASLSPPRRHATGVNIFTTAPGPKRFRPLPGRVPAATTTVGLLNPNCKPAVANAQESEAAARTIGRTATIFNASSDAEIETAFAKIVQVGSGALLVGADPFFNSRRGLIVALAS